ncbi:VWA domain-containing protein [Edaphobacter bradus]|uniref:VWA domain-containing protein n=1 Tax=Edaphobacter bradus TaxID=2259016 RepID=UPI0021DF648A|nr:VWA domain-containing protein [Edaphobacter bradus]
MTKKLLLLPLFLTLSYSGTHGTVAQDDSRIFVNVVLVQLNVAVTDRNGNYISGLRPEDFAITEDKIPEKIATFEEGNEPTRMLIDNTSSKGKTPPKDGLRAVEDKVLSEISRPAITGASVFILFDTSNYMYRGFVFAQDAIADFIRQLEDASKLAFYSYSRNLSRAVSLTPDRSQVLRGVRSTVAGDDAALYNSLLMTVKDAAQFTGKKAIVVFSNGPDNASLVPPEDVAELAQSTGTIIYMVSTRAAETEPVSSAVFERMSKATGGKAYFSRSWGDETKAFSSIRDDLAHLYSLSYYPQPNANHGWRSISVKLVGDRLQKYRVRTRDGYRLQQAQVSTATFPAPDAQTVAR